MSFDDFESFKNSDGGEPPDGSILPARLERASVFESQRGDRFLKTEWSSGRYWWEYLRGVNGFGRQMAQELVLALGIDMSALKSWDELGDELAVREGTLYTVRVERNGNFLNTFVEDKPQGVQEALPDVPIDTGDFAPMPAGAVLDDDDIPF
jgi:hypothetical protein